MISLYEFKSLTNQILKDKIKKKIKCKQINTLKRSCNDDACDYIRLYSKNACKTHDLSHEIEINI